MKTRIVLLMIILLAFAVCGCQEQQTKVWGQGELPNTWTQYFGEDNSARLNYVQTNSINRIGQAIAELQLRVTQLEEKVDPNMIKEKNNVGEKLSETPG